MMYQISNEKFGLFIAELRKEKNLTQKQFAEQLFVSDKTVSKWERGLSMPNVTMLIPIADFLGVTVTELLRGEHLETDKNLNNEEVENLVVGSLDLTVRDSMKQNKRKWRLAYAACLLITIMEISLLYLSGLSLEKMKNNVILIAVLMLIFGGWFCFFAKDLLPTYFDENKIEYYSQGIFRMNLPGVSFNNGNWGYICSTMKAVTLSVAVLYPPICFVIVHYAGEEMWEHLQNAMVLIALGSMFGAAYFVGKKYE